MLLSKNSLENLRKSGGFLSDLNSDNVIWQLQWDPYEKYWVFTWHLAWIQWKMKRLKRRFFFCHFWKPSGWWILRGTLRVAGCYEDYHTELTYCYHLLPKLICSHQLSRGGFTSNSRKHASGHQISYSFYRHISHNFIKKKN